jgi:hypothetical protein
MYRYFTIGSVLIGIRFVWIVQFVLMRWSARTTSMAEPGRMSRGQPWPPQRAEVPGRFGIALQAALCAHLDVATHLRGHPPVGLPAHIASDLIASCVDLLLRHRKDVGLLFQSSQQVPEPASPQDDG